jgi:hypothetical protein
LYLRPPSSQSRRALCWISVCSPLSSLVSVLALSPSLPFDALGLLSVLFSLSPSFYVFRARTSLYCGLYLSALDDTPTLYPRGPSLAIPVPGPASHSILRWRSRHLYCVAQLWRLGSNQSPVAKIRERITISASKS